MLTKTFILAGRAIFTVANPAGERYTFRVGKKDADGRYPTTYFLSLLTGPNNEADYTYLGILNDQNGGVRLTAKSRMNDDARPVRVVRWALSKVWAAANMPEGYKVCHEGRCGRCGRTLTVPESIESGFGPECIQKLAG